MLASIWTFLIPVYVLGFLLLLLGTFALLARIQNGRYLRPVIQLITKVPLFRKLLTKASQAALERQNPELASAVAKMERFGNVTDPQKAQQALSRLSAAERRAYLAAAGEQGAMPTPTSREQRRQLEKMQRRTKKR